MKRIITLIGTLILALALTLSFSACSSTSDSNDGDAQAERSKVKIGITGEAENVIWEPVISELSNEGIDIEIINFADYTLLNGALVDGDIDLNAFQHYAYLNQEIEEGGYDIVSIGDTYISAMCIYSEKIKSIDDLKDGDKIAIPSDSVNLGRALSVAQGAGIITLSEPKGFTYEITDVADNPKNIEFIQVDGAQIPSLLPDVAVGIINGNYALDFGLSPKSDAIFYDDVSFYPDNRYVNNITARAKDKDNEVYLKIVKAYQSETTEQIYKDEFDASYLPGWKSLNAS